MPLWSDLNHEEFWVLLLDRGNKIIDQYKISQGGIAGTLIDVRIILKNALEKWPYPYSLPQPSFRNHGSFGC
jgi:DNA repair protein RadC